MGQNALRAHAVYFGGVHAGIQRNYYIFCNNACLEDSLQCWNSLVVIVIFLSRWGGIYSHQIRTHAQHVSISYTKSASVYWLDYEKFFVAVLDNTTGRFHSLSVVCVCPDNI